MRTAQRERETPWYQRDAHRPSDLFIFSSSVERARLFTMACISLGTRRYEAKERVLLERFILHSLSMMMFVYFFSVVLLSGFLWAEDLSCICLCSLGYPGTKKKKN